MAEFNSVTTTEQGLKLIALSAGMTKPLTFTKLVIGSGRPNDGDDVTKYTAVKTPRMTCSVSKITPVTDETDAARWSVYAAFSNDTVDEGYYMEEIGLYAKVTATDYTDAAWNGYAGEEVLFGYAYALKDKADWLPDKSTPLDVMEWVIYATVGNASSVTAIIPPETCARAEDLENHTKDPDAHADIVAKILAQIKEIYTPHIGDIICTKDKTNPSNRYPGTTWEMIEADTFLMAGTTSTSIGKTGGANTHTISVAEMPSHSHTASGSSAGAHTHSGSSTSAGGHTHTRGSMNITGTFCGVGETLYGPVPTLSGAFYVARNSGGVSVSNDGGGDDLYGFDASKSWTGETSSAGAHTHTVSVGSAGAHTHTISVGNTGSGQEYDCRPKYLTVIMWIRTA